MILTWHLFKIWRLKWFLILGKYGFGLSIRKFKYSEEGILEEEKTHKEGAWFCRGYNVAIDDIVRFIFEGKTP